MIYHRTVTTLLTGCLSPGDKLKYTPPLPALLLMVDVDLLRCLQTRCPCKGNRFTVRRKRGRAFPTVLRREWINAEVCKLRRIPRSVKQPCGREDHNHETST
jgi:hypothetical protein